MTPDEGGDQLTWVLRRYAWVVVVCAIVGSALPLLLMSSRNTYSATALVVADHLAVSAASLPRFGSVVFEDGAVAKFVIEQEGLKLRPEQLIPKKISVQPVQDTILFQIIATDASPEVAARLANDAAASFVVELNRPGKGVGTFSIQQSATAPTSPLPGQSVGTVLLVGFAAGALAGFGVLGLVVLLTQPVTGPASAAPLVGAPLLGSVVLPRRMKRLPQAREVGGSLSLTNRLFVGNADQPVVIYGANKKIRVAVALMVAEVASAPDSVLSVITHSDEVPALREIVRRGGSDAHIAGTPLIDTVGGIVLVRGGAELLDGRARCLPNARRLCLVVEGERSRTVRRKLDLLAALPDHVVFVRIRDSSRVGRLWRRGLVPRKSGRGAKEQSKWTGTRTQRDGKGRSD